MLRIAIVEDNDTDRKVVIDAIATFEKEENENFHISDFHDAMDFLEQRKTDFQIVFMDIQMPYMDGLELSRQLKQLYPNIRIIILSGFDEFEYAKEAVSLNAEEYLLKPIDAIQLQQVFTRIKNALDKEKLDQALSGKLIEEVDVPPAH